MSDELGDLDTRSDELIVIISSRRSAAQRAAASTELYERHASWVVLEISKNVFNPDDVQDIAQTVWMMVLQPEKLASSYKNREGKFRAYLRAPIRWAILKHLDKIPFSVGRSGEKAPISFAEIDQIDYEQGLEKYQVDEIVESFIKPALKELEIKNRNVYLVTEYDVLFESTPSVAEIASINGLSEMHAKELIRVASRKAIDACTDQEFAVYMARTYDSIIDPIKMKESSGRYLASLIGLSDSVYRKRLHTARKYLLKQFKLRRMSDE